MYPMAFDELLPNVEVLTVSYSSPIRETSIATEYAPIREFLTKIEELVMSPDLCMNVVAELRNVYAEWDR